MNRKLIQQGPVRIRNSKLSCVNLGGKRIKHNIFCKGDISLIFRRNPAQIKAGIAIHAVNNNLGQISNINREVRCAANAFDRTRSQQLSIVFRTQGKCTIFVNQNAVHVRQVG